MSIAKFTITYYYQKYHSGDIDKRHKRSATVYAANLTDAIDKVKDFDSGYLGVAEGGVQIKEIGSGKNNGSVSVS